MAKRTNQLVDEADRSPICKRARYDLDSSESVPWTLSKNELILHSVYDSGVGSLSANSDVHLETNEANKKTMRPRCHILSPNSKSEQIAILEASLPENTLQKLSNGEVDMNLTHQAANPEPSKINYFNFLSDEVILHIFQKLTKNQLVNIALVCQRFSQLVEDESLWVRMDVSNKTVPMGLIGKLLSRQVIILKLSKSRIMTPLILPHVNAAQPDFRSRLMYLDLTRSKICPQSLVELFGVCKRLKKLSLESVHVDDNVLANLANNKDIEVLNLAMCTGIGCEGMKKVLANCRKIRELNLAWTYLPINCVELISEKLPYSLSRLNFSGCRKQLLDRHISRIVTICPNIRELDLSDCTVITGESIRRITNLAELNCLAISRCYMIPCRSILYLKKNRCLVYLDIHGNYTSSDEQKIIEEGLGYRVSINKFMFSSIARPCVGNKSTIWNMKVRD